jgi:diguanylate cyclase (GGDEF)-like protein
MSPLTHPRRGAPEHAVPRSYASSVDDLAAALMNSGLVAFALVDSGHVVASSPALRELLGAASPGRHLDGSSLEALAVEPDRAAIGDFARRLLRSGARAEHRCRLLHADGSAVPVLLQGASVPVEGAFQVVLVAHDLRPWVGQVPAGGPSHILEAADSATGCATYPLLFDRMRLALASARRYRRRAAVLHIELASLDRVLEGLSPGTVAEVEMAVADTLRSVVRDCDTIARLTTCEFVALLPEVGRRTDAGVSAARLVEAVSRLFERNPVRVAASVGIAVYPTDATNAERLLAAAGVALRAARKGAGGRFAFADATDLELHAIEPIVFLPEHRLGVAPIDDEHEALVAATAFLIDRLRGGAGPHGLERGLRELMDRLGAHFTTEARHADGSPYEGALERHKSNLRLLEELHCILLDVNAHSVALAIRHLRDWLTHHVQQPDPVHSNLAS